jgi:uncharacterized cupin superfamily protein
MSEPKSPILNIADADLQERPPDPKMPSGFAGKFARISSVVGGRQLGYNLTVVPPGKRAFPLHSHRRNDEMFFILEGEGTLRFGDRTYPLKKGDVVGCPAGGPEFAHQIINSGAGELRYLSVSGNELPEICDYPDSGKTGFFSGEPGKFSRALARTDPALGYWDGE